MSKPIDANSESELQTKIETEFKRIAGVEVLPIYNIPTAVAHVMEAVKSWHHQQLEAKTGQNSLPTNDLRAGLQLIFFPSPIPTIASGDAKVVLDKAEAFVNSLVEAKITEARLDEVNRIPYWGTPYGTEVFGYERLFRDNRIAQLTNNKTTSQEQKGDT